MAGLPWRRPSRRRPETLTYSRKRDETNVYEHATKVTSLDIHATVRGSGTSCLGMGLGSRSGATHFCYAEGSGKGVTGRRRSRRCHDTHEDLRPGC